MMHHVDKADRALHGDFFYSLAYLASLRKSVEPPGHTKNTTLHKGLFSNYSLKSESCEQVSFPLRKQDGLFFITNN